MNKICCIFNTAPHYRDLIYHLIDEELHADFYIGDSSEKIKLMNYNVLKGYKATIRTITLLKPFYWQKGVVGLSKKKYQTYIITGEFFCLSTWLFLALCKLLRKRTVVWTHGWYGRETLLKKMVKHIFFSLSTDILLYGEYAKQLMVKEGVNPKKLHVIANSLNYDEQCEIRKSLRQSNLYADHFHNDCPTLIFTGRLTKVKRLDLLIKAYSYLKKSGICLNLVLVGNEMPDFHIKEILQQENVSDSVWLFGACYNEQQLAELFYNATVCVSPGNVGLTAVHAFTYGCPVITHNNFSNQMPEFEIIEEGVTGCFFQENNWESLCSSIKNWIEYSSDKRESIRRSCYKLIDTKYNPHYQLCILKEVLNVY